MNRELLMELHKYLNSIRIFKFYFVWHVSIEFMVQLKKNTANNYIDTRFLNQ